mmetsp:Transcript_19903/g.48864  ORF Transcript_19903/g.48864 Transcript_19903/m.48864 type:complete len:222 (-) Transcript_19903:1806-2471(-)
MFFQFTVQECFVGLSIGLELGLQSGDFPFERFLSIFVLLLGRFQSIDELIQMLFLGRILLNVLVQLLAIQLVLFYKGFQIILHAIHFVQLFGVFGLDGITLRRHKATECHEFFLGLFRLFLQLPLMFRSMSLVSLILVGMTLSLRGLPGFLILFNLLLEFGVFLALFHDRLFINQHVVLDFPHSLFKFLELKLLLLELFLTDDPRFFLFIVGFSQLLFHRL